MSVRDTIIVEAREWVGTKWQHAQSCKGVGTDCIGFVAGVARELGFASAKRFRDDARFRGYGKTPDPAMLRAAVAEYLDPVSVEQPGDILLMDHELQPFPHHFGILTSSDYMIHAYASARKVVENRIDEAWRGRIVGAFKFREVA